MLNADGHCYAFDSRGRRCEGGGGGSGILVQHRCEGVKSEEKNDSIEDAGQRRSDTGFGENSSAAEGPGRRVGSEEGAE